MRRLGFLLAAASSLFVTGQQEAPARGPGTFQASATGPVAGALNGYASATRQPTGRRELYFVLHSDQMLQMGRMLSVTVSLPDGSGTLPVDGRKASALIQWENLADGTRSATEASGSVTIHGRDLLAGEFRLEAKGKDFAISGTFDSAPLLEGLD